VTPVSVPDDLRAAYANVEWVEANLPSLHRRITDWLKLNVHLEIKELGDASPNDIIVASEREPLPLHFNVESGAYINALRSSLDILACAIAVRNGIAILDEVYFPVARSAAAFSDQHGRAAKFLRQVSISDRQTIESLKPYQGGDPLIWPLHRLDILRKHRRLLEVDVSPRTFHITMWGNFDEHITPIRTGWMRSHEQETVLALIKKGTPKPPMSLTPHITINEPDLGRKPLHSTLEEFTHLVRCIIGMF
jgi:hypothetical protein